MTKIQKTLKEISELRDFYKKTEFLRERIRKKGAERLKADHEDTTPNHQDSERSE